MDDLDRLLAERACERLIVEYCRRVDFGEAGRIAELFTEGGRWEGTDLVLDGREEIRAWFERREAVARRVSRHVNTNVAIDVLDEDRAESLCYLINYRRDRAEGDERYPVPGDIPKYVGELRDRFERTSEGWRFSARKVDVAFFRPSRRPAPTAEEG